MKSDELYDGREQSWIKHIILREYLLRLAIIVGRKWDTIVYADCFAGPWNVRSDELKDSSFYIAVETLLQARDYLAKRGLREQLGIKCFFLEKKRAAYKQLEQFAAQKQAIAGMQIETRNSEFKDALPDVLKFVRSAGPGAFPFIFIDPTGWSGFPMSCLRPLLRLTQSQRGEVLVNLMTSHILRFVDEPRKRESFEEWYGGPELWSRLQGLAGLEREDALVEGYCRQLMAAGGFPYTCPAVVLNPDKDEAYFHLIYGTHDPMGVEQFKEAEKKAMEAMEDRRKDIEKKRREQKQPDLFSDKDVLYESTYYDRLRAYYLAKTEAQIEKLLRTKKRVLYDTAWALALTNPLVWESDLKKWIDAWKKKGLLALEGVKPPERVPKRKAKHYLVWLAPG